MTLTFEEAVGHVAQDVMVVSESHQMAVESLIQAIVGHKDFGNLAAHVGPSEDFWNPDYGPYRPYNVQDGVLKIPVRGMLLSNFPFALGSYATGYQYIEQAVLRGAADANVRAVALMINSPGGHASEAFDVAENMRDTMAQSGKPFKAMVYDSAYSGGYIMASSTDEIVMSRTAGVGSIGVVVMHVDVSNMMQQKGIKVTFISAPKGGDKTAGNPYSPLSESASEAIQQRVDMIYEMFVQNVLAGRKNMDDKGVRDTKARTFTASEAVKIGLADRVLPLAKAMSAFADGTSEVKEMTTPNNQTSTNADASAASLASAKADGFSEGVASERARINAIISSDAGKERPKAALSMALKTGMSAAEAVSVLSELPAEASTSSSAAENFNSAMKKHGAGVDAGSDPEPKASASETSGDVTSLAKQWGLHGFA